MKKGEGNGISWIGALELILIVLKLVGVIHCSWLLVLSPILVEIFIIIVILVNMEWWSK